MAEETSTEQVIPQDNPMNLNPTGKGGFGDHPENRNPGGWDKTKSISYQYNRLLRMSQDEWAVFGVKIKEGETTMAERIAYERLKDSLKDLQTTKEITDRTEGKAPQSVLLSNPDGSLNPYNALTAEELRKLARE